jgi:nitrogen fixation protein FixH
MTVGPTRPVRPITGRTVLIGMIAFFGVIMAVNAVFVYFALDSWPGLSSDQAYEDGLAYNATLEAAKTQKKLGWTSVVDVSGEGVLGVRIRDKMGIAIGGLNITAQMLRPTHERDDHAPDLVETSVGLYTVNLSDVAQGQWRLELTILHNGKTQYFAVHEVMVE